MKRPKHLIWIFICAIAVIATLVGVFLYNTRSQAVLLDTSFSPDGNYQLSLFSVGEPDWPFGRAYGRITLTKEKRKISETEIDLAQDGCQITKENWSVAWRENCSEVTLHASEQDDEHWHIFFDGQAEQFADPAIETAFIPSTQKEKPTALSMTASERESGESLFLVSADDFIEGFNYLYEERNGHSYLKPLDAWRQLDGKTPFYEYDSNDYHFSADPQRWSMPTISIFAPETGEGIYEFKLTFDDHGYQEAMNREFQEICFCALSTILSELSEDEITALYSDLYAQTGINFWGDYYPDSDEDRPGIDAVYRSESVGLYGYYGAGTANICIVPLTDHAAEYMDEHSIECKIVS